jgi:AbrB family looped-hinge helix DNA binding protein
MPRNTSTVTRKGQVTIPIAIRRSLGIHEGDQVEFSAIDNAIKVVPMISNPASPASGLLAELPPDSPVRQAAGSLSEFARNRPMSEEERRQAEEEAIDYGWTERERRYLAQREGTGE